ncbi:MAG TPA: energy transducer TonB [Sphingomicrobium sp.]|nr:energy transducer TonB [Sphingomicrobium sp.]
MPVYASTPGFADHRRHPRALMLIVGGHAILIAAVMTAKMDLPIKIIDSGTDIQFIPEPVTPPPPPTPPKPATQPTSSSVDRVPTIVPTPQPTGAEFDPTPAPTGTGPEIGTGIEPGPTIIAPQPPVRMAARFITPERYIKPPYPADKQRLEEEATIRLKLSIDERGRVTSVEPVGKVDRSFFEAARRHLIANWRYKPATEDGHPIASSTVITLSFRLA